MRGLICILSLLVATPSIAQPPQPTLEEIQTKNSANAHGQGATAARSSAQQAKTIASGTRENAYQRRTMCTDGDYLAMGDARFSNGDAAKAIADISFLAGDGQLNQGINKMITGNFAWAQSNFGAACTDYAAAIACFLVAADLFDSAKEDYDDAADNFSAAENYYILGSMY